jgi:hypothetical protein
MLAGQLKPFSGERIEPNGERIWRSISESNWLSLIDGVEERR